MECLKGKSILIGKEPGGGRLLIAIQGGKSAVIPIPVPGSVSRCLPAEGVAHARITIDPYGHLTIANLKSQNVTYVNGSEIVSKQIQPSSSVALGRDRFNLNISMVLDAARKLVMPAPAAKTPAAPPQVVKTYNIRHLKKIYNSFHAKTLARQKKQKNLGILSASSMFFTIGSGAIAGLAKQLGISGIEEYLWIAPVLGFVVFIISIFLKVTDNSIEEADAANLEYTKRFVCPNPECGKFLGNMPYELMKTQYSMQCPYCKSKFVEK